MDPMKKTPKKKMAIILTASLQDAFSLLKLILMSTIEMMRVMATLRMLRMTPVKDEYWSMKRPKTSKKTTWISTLVNIVMRVVMTIFVLAITSDVSSV